MMVNEDCEKMTAGDLLKQVRQRSGKTQKEIAKEMGLSNGAVSQWEMNDRNVPFSRIHEVAMAYGMTDEEECELIGLRDNPNTDFRPSSEYRVFYELIMLPQKTRERVIRAVRAYESASEE
jgi:transcriptional regulator with XRE-family HTH domain